MKSIMILLLLFVAATSASTPNLDFCPTLEEIQPCSCLEDTGIVINCDGPLVLQKSLENLFNVIRSYNSRPYISLFSVKDTNLQTVDLTPLTNVSFGRVIFQNNANLTTIVASPPGHQFRVIHLHLINSPLLRNNGFTNTLAPSALSSFQIKYSSIQVQDILPGLSSHDQLDALELSFSNAKTIRIGGGQFKTFPWIRNLTLASIGLEEIGAEAFHFDEYPEDFPDALFIILNGNNVTDANIHPDHGLDKMTNRNVYLYLENNNLETLSDEKFGPFLRSAGFHSLRVEGNVIVCDQRVKWLKDGRQFYQNRVQGADCVNDPGQTVFTSPLIP